MMMIKDDDDDHNVDGVNYHNEIADVRCGCGDKGADVGVRI